MKIIGIEKTSLIDYPDKVATVIFLAGCNFLCPYCHNSTIVEGIGKEIKEDELIEFLNKRKKFIDAISITGGEPTLHKDLYNLLKRIKNNGFFVKLDTNGTNPNVLKSILDDKLVDYIAMDVKAPFKKYNLVAGAKVNANSIKQSIQVIKKSGVEYEFRTTVCKELLSLEDIIAIAKEIKGSKKYFIQNFKDAETVIVGKNQLTPYKAEELTVIREKIENWFAEFKIR
ncbi:MAG: anaerobic ribonucleoside-triphosphate reductase activating protein [Alkaliphilus sp.]|nr:MAG: anaerobic ribonucleoside-triphosphate reductase activating protein [Alkaliphilus sp.]